MDNKEIAVPKLYPETLQPNDYRPRPDPAVKTHDLERGPRARKAGHQPTGDAPATGLPGAEGAPLGAHESTQGTPSILPTRTGYHLPIILAPSLMPQLHDA